MPKQHNDLYAAISSFGALRQAARKAVRGKRKKPGASEFFANLEPELLRLSRELSDGRYRPGKYVEIKIRDPKERLVSAAPFRDRVVHHALYDVIQPIFERGFIGNSYANRVGKGTHAAIEAYERYRDRHAHVLRCDIFRYFPSIDHEILKAMFRRRIACEKTLWLMDRIVDGSNAQEPVRLHFLGDTLFTPLERRRGLPIGNLTSQFFANLYLDRFDHFVTEVLEAPYVRYVDDFALFDDDPAVLACWRARVAGYFESLRLRLHPRKTFVHASICPAVFLGYNLEPLGLRRLPEDNVRRFRNRLRGLRDRWRSGSASELQIQSRVRAWIAHAEHARTWRLRHAIFKHGWFDPARCLKPERPPVSVLFAAVPGITNHRTSARPTATGTTPRTGTTISVSVLPARFTARTGGFTDPPGVHRSVQGRS